SEIRFPGKPSESVRDTLKAAGYRWSRYNGCWWGKTDNIPTFSGFESDATSTPINHADKLRTIADKMQTTIDGKFADRQTNTPKRLAQANHTRFEGERLQRTQKALYALAGLHDLGTVPEVLQGLTTKKAVYDLMAEKTESVQNGYHEYRIGTNVAYYDTPEALALWELLTPESEADKQAKELQRKVDGLQFSNIPGYFPTPAPVIEQMLNYACVQSCHHVLEPSAGHGAIADALAAIMQDGHIDCVESNYTLRDILQAKGYNVIEHNFMELAADPLENEHFYYDRVVMNPPFENLQDVDHIRHAFDLLKDGGRLVSIMSPSPFTRSDKKCEAFRQWFDNLGGERVELPEGSFKPSGTNINTIMVIIDKN
ncbi:MAG: methyltransferase, partial [Gammaproteobacteria bacterium]|nr:methyltransferase [Gammaproteobacteria bacterium]